MKKDINSKFVQRYYRELTDLFYNKKIDLTRRFTKRDFNDWTHHRLNREIIVKFSNIRYLFVRAGFNMFGEHLFRAKYNYLEHFNIDTLASALGALYPTKSRQEYTRSPESKVVQKYYKAFKRLFEQNPPKASSIFKFNYHSFSIETLEIYAPKIPASFVRKLAKNNFFINKVKDNALGSPLYYIREEDIKLFNVNTVINMLNIVYPLKSSKEEPKIEKQLTTAQKEVQDWQENKKKIEELKGYLSGPVEYLHLVIDAAVELENNKDSSNKVLIKYITKAYNLGKLHGKI